MNPRPHRPLARRSMALASATLGALALAACAEEAAGPGEPVHSLEFPLQLGAWDSSTETFVELPDAAQVEIVMGFQGLVFVNLALLTDEAIPQRFRAEGELTFLDTGEMFPVVDNQVFFEPLPGETWLVPSFRIPLSGTAATLDGREIELVVTLSSQDDTWCSDLDKRLVLHDGDCVHNPDGTFVCG